MSIHNVCLFLEIRKIIPKFSQILLKFSDAVTCKVPFKISADHIQKYFSKENKA